jgi:hypothetical protein
MLLAGACSWYPQAVGGVPPGEPWVALPLRRWLAEERAVPEAMAACFDPACPHRLAVAVVRASGAEAEALSALLDDPTPLARRLAEPAQPADPKRRRPASTVAVNRLQAGPLKGFTLTLARQDGSRAPAHAAVLGDRSGESLRVVMVIGANPDSVAAMARRVAAEHPGLARRL